MKTLRMRTLLPIFLVAMLSVWAVPGHAQGAAVTPLDDNSHPSPFVWTQGPIKVVFDGESPSFHVLSLNDSRVGLSVSVQGIAEVNRSGGLVAYAPFSSEGSRWNLSWTNVSGGLLVNLTGSVPASLTQGSFNASGLPEELGNPIGMASIVLTFHLHNSSGPAGWTVKFDLSVNGWPWVSPSDELGTSLDVEAESATHVATNASDDGVTEGENASGAPVASLTWGNSATVTYPSGASRQANVSAHTLSSDNGVSSGVRLLFTGVAGGYDALFYDPSVWLNAMAFQAGGGVIAWLLSPEGLVVMALGSAVVLILAAVAMRARSQRPTVELGGLLPHCPHCGRPMTVTIGQGVRILRCDVCNAHPASGLGAMVESTRASVATC